jgi:hypothetical protein
MFKTSKLGNLMAAIGAVGGGLYALKNNKSNISLITFIGVAGVGGYMIGNALTNYYKTY